MKNVLIVESGAKNTLHQKLIKSQKYRVDKINSFHNLSSIYREGKFDLVLIANHSPSLQSKKFFEFITEQNKEQKILHITDSVNNCFLHNDCKKCTNLFNLKTFQHIKGQYQNITSQIDSYNNQLCEMMVQTNILNNLKNISFFSHLNKEQIKKLKQIVVLKRYDKGNIIFYERDRVDFFYFLLSGKLKEYNVATRGMQVILNEYDRSGFFGESDSFTKNYFSQTVESLGKSYVLLLKKEEFKSFILKDPELSLKMMEQLSNSANMIKDVIRTNLVMGTSQRVAKELYKEPDLLKYRKKGDIAMQLNMASETFSRILKKFKELEILNDELNVVNLQKLKNYM
jgi:CRP/FNR family transcriptional regulator